VPEPEHVAEFVHESVITVAAPVSNDPSRATVSLPIVMKAPSPGEPSTLLPMVAGSRPGKDAYVPPCMLG
jgi:hypothetical protein